MVSRGVLNLCVLVFTGKVGVPCVEPLHLVCLFLGQHPILCGWIQSVD